MKNMWRNRILYLGCLAAALVFSLLDRQWFSSFLLTVCFLLPIFSFLCSLSAMLKTRISFSCPEELPVGSEITLDPEFLCPLPCPPVACRICVTHLFSKKKRQMKPGTRIDKLPCGKQEISFARCRVFDYLGLIGLPIKSKKVWVVSVYPMGKKPGQEPDWTAFLPTGWRKKTDGGVAENHELREYQPGDELQKIHWKMSAKTGKIIFRQGMEPADRPLKLVILLQQDEEKLDRDYSELLWISDRLLEQQRRQEFCFLSPAGCVSYLVSDSFSQRKAVLASFDLPAFSVDDLPKVMPITADIRIGGEEDDPFTG